MYMCYLDSFPDLSDGYKAIVCFHFLHHIWNDSIFENNFFRSLSDLKWNLEDLEIKCSLPTTCLSGRRCISVVILHVVGVLHVSGAGNREQQGNNILSMRSLVATVVVCYYEAPVL